MNTDKKNKPVKICADLCPIKKSADPSSLWRASVFVKISPRQAAAAGYADLIFTLATDTHGPTLTFSSADNGRGKTVNRYAIIKTIEPLNLLTHH